MPLIPNLPPNDHQILSNVVDRSVSSRRALLLLLGGFAVFALLLAALGIYGVISYSVTQRRSEIAIRMALGASAAEIRQGTLGNTLALAGLGIALGFVASLALAEAATKLLYGVSGRDPLTYAVGATVMTLIAVLAGLIPAQRAARTDPITVLKGS